MDAYRLAMIAHLVGTIALFAGLVLTIACMVGLRNATSAGQLRRWAGRASRADKLLPVGAGLLLVSGVYATATAWGWRSGWVNVSLATLLLVSPLAPAVIARRLAAIHAAADGIAVGPIPTSLVAATRDPLLWASVCVMAAMSLGILLLMAAKPATGGAIATLGIALLAGLVAALPLGVMGAARRA